VAPNDRVVHLVLPHEVARPTVAEETDPEPTGLIDIALVGCGRRKRAEPSPAKELYTSEGFRARRRLAEFGADAWFILSAEHGLVTPDEWLAPYDLTLNQTSRAYRQAWGSWCVARLVGKLGSLDGRVVQVLAPAAYADAVRRPLSEAGAVLSEPLLGKTQGVQLAWFKRQDYSGLASLTADYAGKSAEEKHARDAAIAASLLAYRQDHAAPTATRLGFAHSQEADEFLVSDPFAFLLGVIFDEGIKAERAWQAPYELRKRLGHLDPWRMRRQLAEIRAAVTGTPMLHRYREIMAAATERAADRVCEDYDGNASAIWAPGSSAADVERRLLAFHRIGPKKAAMAVELLVSHLGVELDDLTGTNVAYDVHVRRVFLRTGLVDVDSIEHVTAVGRRLHPERPGFIDLPTWLIGREWCRPTTPLCGACPLTHECRKLTARNLVGV